ncbi:hypothetical protein LCGC14_1374340 [marine sediment metagenome]|uniref:Uncharacterized protein n=1 Tax=marine sediment metagenome TaxID=412755 RepID=A0A0F9KQI3_9ZZZZ
MINKRLGLTATGRADHIPKRAQTIIFPTHAVCGAWLVSQTWTAFRLCRRCQAGEQVD